MFGLLGPEATAITYRVGGKLHKQAVTGPEGGYLIVLASHPKRNGVSIGPMPAVGYTVRRIDYRDAPSCRGRRDRSPARCPLVGYVSPSDAPTAKSVRRPLKVRVSGHGVDVSFRAPVAVRDAKSYYTLMVQFDHGQGCRGAGSMGRSDRDVAKGAITHLRVALLARCTGSVSGTVTYVTSAAAAGPMSIAPGDRANLTVGRFTSKLR